MERLAIGRTPSTSPKPEDPERRTATTNIGRFKKSLNGLFVGRSIQVNKPTLKDWHDLAGNIMVLTGEAYTAPETYTYGAFNSLMATVLARLESPEFRTAHLDELNRMLTQQTNTRISLSSSASAPLIAPPLSQRSVPMASASSAEANPSAFGTPPSAPPPQVALAAPTAAPNVRSLANALKAQLNSLLPTEQQITGGDLGLKDWYDLARAILPEPKPAEFLETPAPNREGKIEYKPLMAGILQAALTAATELTEGDQTRIQGVVAQFTAGQPGIKDGFTLGRVPVTSVAVRTTSPLHRTQTVLPPLHPSLTYLASRPFQVLPLSQPVTAHNLALIFGDAWIEDTPFEGGSVTTFINTTIETLESFIRDFPEPRLAGPLNDLLVNFRLLAKISAAEEHQPSPEDGVRFLIREYSRLIHDLQPGKSVLLPGGWIGVDAGHNILYEIKCEKPGVYSFSLFNTGAGISYHDHTFVDHKMKYAPALSVTDIPARNLDPTFLRTVFELNFIKPTIEKPYGAANVYEGILGLLGGRIVASPVPREPEEAVTGLEAAFMSPQNAGTCARKSLEAAIRSRLSHFLPLYKQYKFREKFAALASFLAGNDLKDTEDQKLLQRVVSKFARTVLKWQAAGVIT